MIKTTFPLKITVNKGILYFDENVEIKFPQVKLTDFFIIKVILFKLNLSY